jgi:hypothetical protein
MPKQLKTDKGRRRPFIATESMTLLHLRFMVEVYMKSLEKIVGEEQEETEENRNLFNQFRNAHTCFSVITDELVIRNVLVRDDAAQTVLNATAYDNRHWPKSLFKPQ